MADLTIKPVGAAGNKLILQDQAGGAVLTTADSGATIANATLNSPTLVTPALGTVASGTLGSAVTGSPALNLGNTTGTIPAAVIFPAGHILQVRTKHVDQDNHVILGSNGTALALTILGGIHMHDITPLESTSTLVISATIHPYGSSGSTVYGYDIWDTRTSAWLGNKPDSYGSTGLGMANGYGAGGQSVHAVTSAGTTATRTYKVGMAKSTGGVMYEHAAGMFTMTIWEIKV
jgi:hypothetical protein